MTMVQRTPPTAADPLLERADRMEHLVAALRALAHLGMDFGVAGHVSVRDAVLNDHFWLNPYGASFGRLDESDLLLVSPHGEIVVGEGILHQPAFSIHGSVLASRPDVNGVVHVHSPFAQAQSARGEKLLPLTQEATAFFESHDIHPYEGIRLEAEEGRSIARRLGQGIALLLQNHGLLTVGASVDCAAWRAISMERACHVQLMADAAGVVRPIPSDLARDIGPIVGSESEGWLNFQPLFEQVMFEKSDG